jgi:ribosomal protein S18 acetylase RimI-like enzyme
VSPQNEGVRPANSLSLRASTSADSEFLALLYLSTRLAELSYLGEPLLRMQYEIRRKGYLAHFPETSPDIIMVAGEPVGSVWAAETPRELILIDIALLPVHRGQGIGSHVLSSIITGANQRCMPIALTVSKSNPAAFRLYERLGFRVVDDSPMDFGMRREPIC